MFVVCNNNTFILLKIVRLCTVLLRTIQIVLVFSVKAVHTIMQLY